MTEQLISNEVDELKNDLRRQRLIREQPGKH